MSFRKVIVATGTKPKTFDFKIPAFLAGRVRYDIAPLLGETGRKMVVAGSGDGAFDYALTLGKKNVVHLLNRGKAAKCLPLLRERIKENQCIVYMEKASVSGVSASRDGLNVRYETPRGPAHFQADYLIGAIGREPDLDFLAAEFMAEVPALRKKGVLYFAGDVKNGLSRQTAIAVGDGLSAAADICRLIRENRS